MCPLPAGRPLPVVFGGASLPATPAGCRGEFPFSSAWSDSIGSVWSHGPLFMR
jgi:hypothetical protein